MRALIILTGGARNHVELREEQRDLRGDVAKERAEMCQTRIGFVVLRGVHGPTFQLQRTHAETTLRK